MSGYFKKLYAPTDEVINASERFYSSPEKLCGTEKIFFIHPSCLSAKPHGLK